MISKTELQQNLRTDIIGNKLFLFESIDSTNACARALAEAGCEEGTVVIAERQTAGKGRLGRTWASETGMNLLFSIVVRPDIKPQKIGLLSLLASVATSTAIEAALKIKTTCKWPNDLLLNEKKCCGILLESSLTQTSIQYAIIGIGLNVNQTQFDKTLEMRATSLRLAAGSEIDRVMLLKKIFEYLDRYYASIQHNERETILDDWRQRATMLGTRVMLLHGGHKISGIARDITHDGGLLLETTAGAQVFYAGDVSFTSINH